MDSPQSSVSSLLQQLRDLRILEAQQGSIEKRRMKISIFDKIQRFCLITLWRIFGKFIWADPVWIRASILKSTSSRHAKSFLRKQIWVTMGPSFQTIQMNFDESLLGPISHSKTLSLSFSRLKGTPQAWIEIGKFFSSSSSFALLLSKKYQIQTCLDIKIRSLTWIFLGIF